MKKWLVGSLVLNVLFVAGLVATWIFLPSIVRSLRAGQVERLHTQFAEWTEPSGGVVFVGDSITAGGLWGEIFPGTGARNRGIGGDTTEDVLARIGQVHALRPEKLFLMIGINDLNRGVPRAETFANLRALFDGFDAQLPDTEIFVQSVLPVNEDWRIEVAAADLDAVNEHLAREARTRGYTFVDLWPVFAGPDGKLLRPLSNDGIHLVGKGYAQWRDAIAPLIMGPSPAGG